MQIQQSNNAHLQMITREPTFLDNIFPSLFYIHFVAIIALASFLTIHGLVSSSSDSHRSQLHPKEWYLPLLSSSACSGIVAFAFQEFASLNPSRAVKAAFWISPLLMCALGVLLVVIGTPGSFAASVVILLSSVVQSLYCLFGFLDIKHLGSQSIGNEGLARAVNLVSGDVDEFMFSCADCCSGVAAKLVLCGNRWGFVQVGMYNKGIVQASMDTWEMFKRIGIKKLIDSDLTSSFCFLCGVSVGSVCALVGGIWALETHKAYATEVSLYTFLIGYFMGRVAISWIQASVAAYYVAYAENPQSQQFDSTIPDYIQELQRLEA